MANNVSGAEMRALGSVINEMFPGMGWCVFTFNFGPGGMGNYLANANREDMVKALRELADHLENGKVFPTPEHN